MLSREIDLQGPDGAPVGGQDSMKTKKRRRPIEADAKGGDRSRAELHKR